ncbi:MAG: YbaK/EbsC family protein [Clostridiales bacterium]|nr:YbaK/EbsC family protein [Clostridiales bacterium]
MSFEKAKEHLKKYGLEDKIRVFDVSSATVPLAAAAVGCEEDRIAKTLSFSVNGECALIVTSGKSKISNPKFKNFFGCKAVMLKFDEVEEKTGHSVGGVCPFGANKDVKIYLDESLKHFETVFPACGSANSAVELSTKELELASGYTAWIDVCKSEDEP